MKSKPPTCPECLQAFIDRHEKKTVLPPMADLVRDGNAALKRLREQTSKAGLASKGKSGAKPKLTAKERSDVIKLQGVYRASVVGERYGISARTVKRIWGNP